MRHNYTCCQGEKPDFFPVVNLPYNHCCHCWSNPWETAGKTDDTSLSSKINIYLTKKENTPFNINNKTEFYFQIYFWKNEMNGSDSCQTCKSYLSTIKYLFVLHHNSSKSYIIIDKNKMQKVLERLKKMPNTKIMQKKNQYKSGILSKMIVWKEVVSLCFR